MLYFFAKKCRKRVNKQNKRGLSDIVYGIIEPSKEKGMQKMEQGFFDRLFDMDNNGKPEDFEKAADFAAFLTLLQAEKDDVAADKGKAIDDEDSYQ
ncbi:MAG TPA: hypothetical protein DDY98_02325 [Ruminococcaceae bacterium]|nr:hypothetical protein [Oscillospiraceae bacterium]